MKDLIILYAPIIVGSLIGGIAVIGFCFIDKKRWKMARKKEYALYIGDDLIGIGTVTELAELTNVKEKTIYFYQTPVYKKRRSKSTRKCRTLVKIEELENELNKRLKESGE